MSGSTKRSARASEFDRRIGPGKPDHPPGLFGHHHLCCFDQVLIPPQSAERRRRRIPTPLGGVPDLVDLLDFIDGSWSDVEWQWQCRLD